MSADAFHVCYGIRWEVDANNDDQVTQLELREDPRQVAARKHDLDCRWGHALDENRHFVLVGSMVGIFGWEHEHSLRLADADTARIVEETTRKLRAAGFTDEPAWHFGFEGDL